VASESVEVKIERILPGGLGLAHAEGRTVLVALAAPGDRLRVQIDRVRGNVAFASIKDIVEPAPARVEPPCQYFGRCGGCDFQQLTYEAQLAAKVEIIRDCLRRIGRIEDPPEVSITPAPSPWHYRSRAQWQYDAIWRRLGYFESGSRRVCDVAECAVLAPPLQHTLESLRRKMNDGLLPDDVRDFRAVVGDDDVSLSPPFAGKGVGEIIRSIHGEAYRFNAEAFFQTNYDLLLQLIDAALKEAEGDVAVDLYCGVGLFTVPLARRFARVVAVEGDDSSAAFARANLKEAALTNATIVKQGVADWLDEHMECGDLSPLSEKRLPVAAPQGRADFLLLDPPRAGAESRVIAGILRMIPRRICYVSCDPATLARDLKKLITGGYSLDSVAAFDMFPQTHHVETIAQLSA
jgi:23S rRNA (uracil1939-C5)-methyltransferase